MDKDGRIGAVADKIAADFGVDRAAVAVAFLLAHPAKILPVMGTNNLDRISRISDALKVQLDRETWYQLYEAALGKEVP
jgi:predicted oxidoreductase